MDKFHESRAGLRQRRGAAEAAASPNTRPDLDVSPLEGDNLEVDAANDTDAVANSVDDEEGDIGSDADEGPGTGMGGIGGVGGGIGGTGGTGGVGGIGPCLGRGAGTSVDAPVATEPTAGPQFVAQQRLATATANTGAASARAQAGAEAEADTQAGAQAEADTQAGAEAEASTQAQASPPASHKAAAARASGRENPKAEPTLAPAATPAPPGGIAAGGLTAELARRIVSNFPTCCAGQFMSSVLSERRFLSCLGVHRTMALFAYAPGTPGQQPRGFAAQPTTGAIRFGLERRSEFLPEVARAMSQVFKGVDKAAVSIHIIGDLVGEPLQRYMPDMPAFTHCCSLHLEAALSKAGFTNIDKTFCAAFEEDLMPDDGEPRPTACAVGDGRRFSLAALDLQTGQVIVQASGTRADVKAVVQELWPAIEEEYERDKALQLERNMTAPTVDARTSFGDSWAMYYEIVAHPLPTLLVSVMVLATIGIFGPHLLPETSAPFNLL